MIICSSALCVRCCWVSHNMIFNHYTVKCQVHNAYLTDTVYHRCYKNDFTVDCRERVLNIRVLISKRSVWFRVEKCFLQSIKRIHSNNQWHSSFIDSDSVCFASTMLWYWRKSFESHRFIIITLNMNGIEYYTTHFSPHWCV